LISKILIFMNYSGQVFFINFSKLGIIFKYPKKFNEFPQYPVYMSFILNYGH